MQYLFIVVSLYIEASVYCYQSLSCKKCIILISDNYNEQHLRRTAISGVKIHLFTFIATTAIAVV